MSKVSDCFDEIGLNKVVSKSELWLLNLFFKPINSEIIKYKVHFQKLISILSFLIFCYSLKDRISKDSIIFTAFFW